MSCNSIISQEEYQALFELYLLTNGTTWSWKNQSFGQIWNFSNSSIPPSNWDLLQPCDQSWQGISCEILNNQCTIISLSLDFYNLRGVIPSTLGLLSNLQSLSLSNNYLSSELSTKIGNLISLVNLDLSSNLISNTLPFSMLNLQSLQHINVGDNLLSGEFPLFLGEISGLIEISIDKNHFTSRLPDIFHHLNNLKVLKLNNNRFRGSFPPSFANLSSIQELNCSTNFFIGSFPSILTKLTTLIDLRLSSNFFDREIPSSISSFESLQTLYLHRNRFSSSLPNELFLLTSLNTLDLSLNRLTGSLPSLLNNLNQLHTFNISFNHFSLSIPFELSNLTSLQIFDAQVNHLTGFLPDSLGDLLNLTQLNLQTNRLQGSLPSSLQQLSLLNEFLIKDNFFIGSIPPFFGTFPHLQTLNLQSNHLNNTIPSQLTLSTSLSSLLLSHNYFSSSFPSQFSVINNLQSLLCSECRLVGSLSSQLGRLSKLQELDFSENQLTGPIPSSIGNLTDLINLDLYSNFLTFTMPSSLGNLGYLQNLMLYENNLSGSIPSEFFGLSSLLQFDLTQNHLTGTIPSSLGSLTDLQVFYLYSNYLEGSVPYELGNFSVIQHFWLTENYFTAQFPASILIDKPYFMQLTICQNYFTGTIPNPIQTPSLQVFVFYSNYISGPIPSTLNSAPEIQVVWLSQNYLTGTIPSNLSTLRSIVKLVVYQNFLTGTLPPELGKSKSFQLLDFHDNLFTNTIPKSYCNISTLSQFIVLDNSFSGVIPPCLFCMPKIQGLILGINCFTGSIPSCHDCPFSHSLVVLDLSDLSSGSSCINPPPFSLEISSINPDVNHGFFPNHFISGTIPSCVWSLPQLTTLYFIGNGLEGTLNADSFNTSSSTLSMVSLSYNRLTGTIPLQIQQYGNFLWLDLSHNRLSGTLDPSLQTINYASYPSDSWIFKMSQNRLSGPFPIISNLTQQQNFIPNMLEGNLFSFDFISFGTSQNEIQALTAYNGSLLLNFSMILSGAILLLYFLIWLFAFVFPMFLKTCDWHVLINDQRDRNPDDFRSRIQSTISDMLRWKRITNDYLSQREISDPRLKDTIQSIKKLTYFLYSVGWESLIVISLVVLSLKSISSYKLDFSTSDYQYGWILSTCFLKGPLIPLLITISIFILMLVTFYQFFQFETNPQLNPHNNTTTTSSTTHSILRFFFQFWKSYFNICFQIPRKSLQEFFQYFSSFTLTNLTFSGIFRFLSLLILILIDVLVILAVNFYYLSFVASNQGSIAIIQFLLAIFKSLWNTVYIPFALRFFHLISRFGLGSFQLSMSQLLYTGLVLNIFNLLLAPCIATGLSDGSCLFPLFDQPTIPPANITSSDCTLSITINQSSVCVQSQQTVQPIGNAFTPPFVYTFDCSSALILQYVPVFLYSISFTGLLQPLLLCFVMNFDSYFGDSILSFFHILFPILKCFPELSQMMLANTLLIHQPSSASMTSNPQFLLFFHLNKAENTATFLSGMVLIKIILYFAMFLTFGLAFPFLGFVIIIAWIVDVEVWFVALGRLFESMDHARSSFLLAQRTDEFGIVNTNNIVNSPLISSSSVIKSLDDDIDIDDDEDDSLENRPSILLTEQHHSESNSKGTESPFSPSTIPSISTEGPSSSISSSSFDPSTPPPLRSSDSIHDSILIDQLKRSQSLFLLDHPSISISRSTVDRRPSTLSPRIPSSPSPTPTSFSSPTSSASFSSSSSSFSSISSIVRYCLYFSLFVVVLFWSLQIFDMIGDDHGSQIATQIVILFLIVLPFSLWIIEYLIFIFILTYSQLKQF